ncbi:MAG: phospho-N-acetylmuramoyl-pentapeptide-transferase [bacterium]
MLYHLLYPLKNIFSPLNVFQYITFRAGGAILTSLIVCFIIGPWIIRKLRLMRISQQVRSDGPPSHMHKKDTPTMGGVLIGISLLMSTLLWARLDNRFIWILVISSVVLGFIGLADDYLKLVKKNSSGLSAKLKLSGQCVLAGSIAAYLIYNPSNTQFNMLVNIPYLKDTYMHLSWFYFIFIMLIIVGASNGVNLTDGQDGLAIGGIIFATTSYFILAYLAGNVKFAEYLRIIYVPGAGEISVFLAALLGSAVGFLWYNTYPAEIFMGDTGSLLLGGVIGIVAVLIRQEILLAIIGGIFVIEVLSVVLQVASFKMRGKRVFKMAPLHHHFEMAGMKEPKITVRFWIVSLILALMALASLKVR